MLWEYGGRGGSLTTVEPNGGRAGGDGRRTLEEGVMGVGVEGGGF